MRVCDRHNQRQAAHRIVVSDSEGYDLCNPCMDEFRNWVQSDGEDHAEEETQETPVLKKRGRRK